MAKFTVIAIAVVAAGMVAGMAGDAVGSAPMLPRSTIAQFYQQHDGAPPVPNGKVPPPDQYPLVTPGGTIPVGGLALRGLYSQARYLMAAQLPDDGPGGIPVTASMVEPAPRSAGDDPAIAEQEPSPPSPVSVPEGGGSARTIDVAAALAMR